MKKDGGGVPDGELAGAIDRQWGSFEQFKELFAKAAIGHFGSGWTWLVKNPGGSLDIVSTGNAGTPLTDESVPLLTCDVWEHAYYIDYRNQRNKYLEGFWNIVNWDFARKNMG
jgi:Fe-Mn family superoxide dismutase